MAGQVVPTRVAGQVVPTRVAEHVAPVASQVVPLPVPAAAQAVPSPVAGGVAPTTGTLSTPSPKLYEARGRDTSADAHERRASAKVTAAVALGSASGAVWARVAQAKEMQAQMGRCEAGESGACEAVHRFEETMRLRLLAYDVPTWAKVAATLDDVSDAMISSAASAAQPHELDLVAWGEAADALQQAATDMQAVVMHAAGAATDTDGMGQSDFVRSLPNWRAATVVIDALASIARPAPGQSGDDIKAAWVQKLGVDGWEVAIGPVA